MRTRLTAFATGLALLALAGTAGAQETGDQNATSTPAAAPEAASPAASSTPAAPARAARRPQIRSWTSDRQDYRPGDVLTVFVDERTLARAVAENSATDRRTAEGLLDILPSDRLGLRTRNDAESSERGRASRNERYRTEMSVRVKEVTPNGVLRIEGRKQYGVGDHEREVILSGFVRPEDVSLANVVRGWRVADLSLRFESNGELVKPDRGLVAKLFDFLF